MIIHFILIIILRFYMRINDNLLMLEIFRIITILYMNFIAIIYLLNQLLEFYSKNKVQNFKYKIVEKIKNNKLCKSNCNNKFRVNIEEVTNRNCNLIYDKSKLSRESYL